MKAYVLTEEQLKKLIVQSNAFSALQLGGVDNWSYYYDSLDDAYTQWAEDIGITNTNEKTSHELKNLITEYDLSQYPTIDWKLP